MGYKPTKKFYTLVFPEHEGLEITVKGLSIGKLVQLSNMRLDLTQENEEDKFKVFRLFASKLMVWNIDHPEPEECTGDNTKAVCAVCGLAEGEPLPTTAEAMECLDIDFIMPIIFGWLSQQSTVSPGKGLSSNGGERITEEAMRQLDALQSQSKLPQPNFS